jgi:IclR family acetate operon transcriptional repressor
MDTRIKDDAPDPGRTKGGDVRVSVSRGAVSSTNAARPTSAVASTTATPPSSTVSSIERITAVLDVFSPAHDRMGVNEIARRSGLPKSTTSRLVSSLVSFGYLRRDGQQVSIGLKLFELGRLSRHPNTLRSLALPTMVDLRGSTLHTVQLSVLEDLDIVTIAILPGRDTPATVPQVGGRAPACSTGAGKAMLAFAERSVVERAIRRQAGGVRRRGAAAEDAEERSVLRELAEIRQTRVVVSAAHGSSATLAASSPVLNRDAQVVAALSVTGSTEHFDPERVGAAVCAAAFRLGRLESLGSAVSGL